MGEKAQVRETLGLMVAHDRFYFCLAWFLSCGQVAHSVWRSPLEIEPLSWILMQNFIGCLACRFWGQNGSIAEKLWLPRSRFVHWVRCDLGPRSSEKLCECLQLDAPLPSVLQHSLRVRVLVQQCAQGGEGLMHAPTLKGKELGPLFEGDHMAGLSSLLWFGFILQWFHMAWKRLLKTLKVGFLDFRTV